MEILGQQNNQLYRQVKAKLHLPVTEMLKSIPETFGIRMNEEPEFQLMEKDENFEVRRYGRCLRAKITLTGMSFDEFRSRAFHSLAGYISGDNRRKRSVSTASPLLDGERARSSETITMTSPILLQQSSDWHWTMFFILPDEYNLRNAPEPLDPEIQLEEIPSVDVAVHTYSGNNTPERIKLYQDELERWLLARPHLHPEGQYMIAQYDAPFVIPFMKKNEVHIRVSR